MILHHGIDEDLIKSHIREYTRKDGTVVREHDDKRIRKHVDLLHHEHAHGEEIHSGADIDHGERLLDTLASKKWKQRDVPAITRDEKLKVGSQDNLPAPPTIQGKNPNNSALISAQRTINRMHEAAGQASDPVAALKAIGTSRANPYLKAVDDYRTKLLEHFGHQVDYSKTHQMFTKDGHTVVISHQDGKHRIEFAAGDADKDPAKVESVKGRSARETVDTGKKDPKFVLGDTNTAYTGKMNKIETQFALVDIDDLTASHTYDGHVNTAYPQDIQPRDRARVASRMQIQAIANDIKPELLGVSHLTSDGAPVIGKDGIVESGNGRTIALGLAYKTGKGDEYKRWLQGYADRVGLKKQDVEKMNHPVLVRVRKTEVNRPEFAREANQSNLMSNSPVEMAFSDADRITDDMLAKYHPDEYGDILNDENRPFISDFLGTLGKNETAGMIDKYGEPNKKLVDRIQAAVFARVYKSEVLTELMVESADSDVRNIINAMSTAAAGYAKIQKHSDLDVTDELLDAIDHIRTAKRNRIDIDSQLAQSAFDADGNMTTVDPVTEELTRAIHQLKGSRRRLADFFQSLTDAAGAEINEREDSATYGGADIFGNSRKDRDKGQIVNETAQKLRDANVRKSHRLAAPQTRHDRQGEREGARAPGEGRTEAQTLPVILLRKSHVSAYSRASKSGALQFVREHEDSRIRHYGDTLAGAKSHADLHSARSMRFALLPHWGKISEPDRDKILEAENQVHRDLKSKDKAADAENSKRRVQQWLAMRMGFHVPHHELVSSGLAERTESGTQLLMFKSLEGIMPTIAGTVLLRKSHIKGHSRRTRNGGLTQVREHDDRRPSGIRTAKEFHAAVKQLAAEENIHPIKAASHMQAAAATLGDERTIGLLGVVKNRLIKEERARKVKPHDPSRHWSPDIETVHHNGRTVSDVEYDALHAGKTPTIGEYLHGREYTLDGVHGHFILQPGGHMTIYPTKGKAKHRLFHEASTKGRHSEAYQKVKRYLGDHWSTDMDEHEDLGGIAHELGYSDHYPK